MSSNYTIYTGHIWKEYSSNKLILTLNGAAAGALQAAIPLWISLVGPLSWVLIQYPWFQCSTLRGSRIQPFHPLYYRQKQVLLRNSSGDLGTASDSYGLFRAWWKHGVWKAFWRTGPLFLTAVLFWCVWQVVAIVSFYIWQTTPPTVGLIRSGICGYNFLEGPGAETSFRRSGLIETIQAETYVTQCYGSGLSGACNVYAKQAVSYTTSNTTCPFATSDICINVNSSPYQLDTGPIDSHTDLGINAPRENRVTYQKINTCSPIHSTKFAHIVNANETDEAYYWPPDTRLQQFYYGPILNTNFSYTFEYSEWTPLDNFPYDIQGVIFNPGPPGTENAWAINTTFANRTDADISILFLTPNSISYNASVDDPFFLTGANYTIPVNGKEYTLYTPAYYVNVMGCIEQHRFCNPTVTNLCTPYTAYLNFQDIPGPLTTLNYNPTQLATAERIASGLEMTLTFNSVNNRRGAALLASQTVSDLLQTKNLHVDQWRTEVENWFAVSLAKLQEGILEFAGGPLDPEIVPYVQFPVDTDTARLCYNQLVQLPSGYVNFDFGAILIVTFVGIFLFVVGMVFEWVAAWGIQKWGRGRGLKEWLEDGQFQLLKRIYAAQNISGWENEEDDFPITMADLQSGAQANGAGNQSAAGIAGLTQGSSSPLLPINTGNTSPGNAGPGNAGPGNAGPGNAGPGSGGPPVPASTGNARGHTPP